MKYQIVFLTFLIFINLTFEMKNINSNFYSLYGCKSNLFTGNDCDLLNNNNVDTTYNSMIAIMNKDLLNSFICKNIKENLPVDFKFTDCKTEFKLCSEIPKISFNIFLDTFENISNNFIFNKQFRPYNTVLILNVNREFLNLIYYFLDKNINSFKYLFKQFDIILIQTDKLKFLYRVNNSDSSKIKLKLNTKETNDIRFKRNLKFLNENNIFLKNKLYDNYGNNFRKITRCRILGKVYKKNHHKNIFKKYKNFIFYYKPVIDAIINKRGDISNEVTLKFEDFNLNYKPYKVIRNKNSKSINDKTNKEDMGNKNTFYKHIKHIKNTKTQNKNFLQSKLRFLLPEDEEIFYQNKNFKNKEEFLNKSLNEKAKGKEKGMKQSLFQKSFINLYKEANESESEIDRDLEKFNNY